MIPTEVQANQPVRELASVLGAVVGRIADPEANVGVRVNPGIDAQPSLEQCSIHLIGHLGAAPAPGVGWTSYSRNAWMSSVPYVCVKCSIVVVRKCSWSAICRVSSTPIAQGP
jgi:hypothetical protein